MSYLIQNNHLLWFKLIVGHLIKSLYIYRLLKLTKQLFVFIFMQNNSVIMYQFKKKLKIVYIWAKFYINILLLLEVKSVEFKKNINYFILLLEVKNVKCLVKAAINY